MECSRADAAAHRLGVARGRHDGARRRAGSHGSSLSCKGWREGRCGSVLDLRDEGGRGGGASDVSRFLIPAAIFLALAGVLYVGVVHSPNKSTMQSALLGKPVPVFELPVLGSPGLTLTNAQLAGRPWVLNVWGTWCAACRDEHEVLLAIARQNVVPLIGLDWKDEDAAA